MSGVVQFAVAGQADKRVSATDPLPVTTPAGSPGSTSDTPTYTAAAQGTPNFSDSITVGAGQAGDLLVANPQRRGGRILNYTSAPIYFWPTSKGATPPSGAPADVVPAASGGLPGQYEFPYAPTIAYRYIGASAGTGVTGLSVETW